MQHYDENRMFLDYIECRSKDVRNDDWEACVGGSCGFSREVIAECAEGEEGQGLLRKSFELSRSLGVHTSPTWVLDGRFKFFGVDAETIRAAICKREPWSACARGG
jgi:hypothetical protein